MWKGSIVEQVVYTCFVLLCIASNQIECPKTILGQ